MNINKISIGLLVLLLALVVIPEVSALPSYAPAAPGPNVNILHRAAAAPGCAGACHNMPVFCAGCHAYPYAATPTPTTSATATQTATATATETATATATETATVTVTGTPTTTLTATPTVTVTEGPTTTLTVPPTGTATSTPIVTPPPPVPELSPLVLTLAGLSGLFLLMRIRKN